MMIIIFLVRLPVITPIITKDSLRLVVGSNWFLYKIKIATSPKKIVNSSDAHITC